MARGLSAALLLLGLLGWWRVGRRSGESWVLVLALIPGSLLLVQGYGGEGIYRVYVFMCLWLAFLGAGLLAAARPERGWARYALAAGSVVAVLAMITATFGQERSDRITPQEVAAATWFETATPSGSIITYLTNNYPSPITARYSQHFTGDGKWGGEVTGDERFAQRELTAQDVPAGGPVAGRPRRPGSARLPRARPQPGGVRQQLRVRATRRGDPLRVAAGPGPDPLPGRLPGSGRLHPAGPAGRDSHVVTASDPTLSGPAEPASLACVIMAHADPVHVRRLVDALDPFPVYLHCDARTPEPVFAELTADLPARCRLLPRMRTGWARWENVAAELAGYRQALADDGITHVAALTGSDYPLASSAEISALLRAHPRTSIALYHRLPYVNWGRDGGLARLRYRHWAWRKRMVRLPIPRRLPAGIRFSGGSQVKVLAREHAQAVLNAADRDPALVRFWRRSWIADETFVGSVLNTPHLTPTWADRHLDADLWHISWQDGAKSPPWLRAADFPDLAAASRPDRGVRPLFARKFATGIDTDVLDLIDENLRRTPDRVR